MPRPRPSATACAGTRRVWTIRTIWWGPCAACCAIIPRAEGQGRDAGAPDDAIKPGTPLEPYLDILRHFDTLLVMSVEPGFGGQSFIPEVLDKVARVRRLVDTGELTILIEIDGGINADTIEQAAEAGVDCFVAGSAVYGAGDPSAAVEALRRQAGSASPHLRL